MKNNIKNLLILLISCLLLITILASCGGDDDIEDENYIVISVYNSPDSAPFAKKVYESDTSFYLGAPQREHCTFLGYFDSPTGGSMIFDAQGYPLVSLDRDMSVYAQWQGDIIEVSFVADEDVIETRNVVFGEVIGVGPTAPEKEGFDFMRWVYLTPSPNGYYQSKILMSNTKLDESFYIQEAPDGKKYTRISADYEIKQYNVTFDYGDPNFENTQIKVTHGTEIPLEALETAKREADDKIITAWSKSSVYVYPVEGVVTEDIVLYAHWTRFKTFTLINDPNNSELNEVVRVLEGESYQGDAPTKDGYEFVGYYTSELFEGNPVNAVSYSLSKTTLYAKWEIVYYDIIFEANGGTGTIPTDQRYTIEESVPLPTDLVKENCTFIGWCLKEDLTDRPFTTLPAGHHGELTLYANYKGEERLVSLDINDGNSSPRRAVVEYGKNYILSIPTYNGYEFAGWYHGDTAVTDKNGQSLEPWEFPDGEITFTAKWNKKYYITLSHSKDGVMTVSAKDYYIEGEAVSFTVDLRFGYEFAGYYIDGDAVCTDKTYEFTMPASDMHIVLQCNPIMIEVTLDAGDGVCAHESVSIPYGEKFTLPVATLRYKSFAGWQVDATTLSRGEENLFNLVDGVLWATDNKGASYFINELTHDITVKAVYTELDPDAPLQIFDASDMVMIQEHPDGDFVLINDIDMAGVDWTPIEFSGTLEGNNFKIKNVSLSSSEGTLGFFTKISGTVQNLIFENISVTSNSYNNEEMVGGVCGELTGTLKGIEIASGNILGNSGRIGGIVGKNNGGTIADCINRANVSGQATESNGSTGGIVAWHASGTISGCKNYGKIDNDFYAGGVIGYSQNTECTGLYNYGTVTGTYDTGGIIGLLKLGGNMQINGWANYGTVIGEQNAGGVIGRIYNVFDRSGNYTATIKDITNEANIIGTLYVGGIFGYARFDNTYNSSNNLTANLDGLKNDADITGTKYVGGLVGYIVSDTSASKMTDSESRGTVTAEAFVGGLAGYMGSVSAEDCSNKGTTIIATGYHLDGTTLYAYVGGYAGYGYRFVRCTNESAIDYSMRGIYVGGIAGYTNGGSEDCINTAAVNAPNADYVGGIVGLSDMSGNTNFYGLKNSGKISGNNCVGGIFGKNNCSINRSGNYTVNMSKLSNTGVISGAEYVGGISGYTYHNNSYNSSNNITVTQSELVNKANVTGTKYVGGLLGYMYSDGSSKLLNSSSSGTITASVGYIGGLAGSTNSTIDDCSNTGTVIAASGHIIDNTANYAYIGGYVGYGYAIKNCINNSAITYTDIGSYVGGIAGVLTGNIENCTNNANITADKAEYVGGIVGYSNIGGSASFISLTNSGEIKGKNLVGGIFGKNNCNINRSGNYTVNMSKLSNTGAISGTEYVGGISGYIYHDNTYNSSNNITATMSELVNKANVTGTMYVGGLIGRMYSDGGSKLSDSSSAGTISASGAYIGGLVGYTNGTIDNCSNEGTVINASGYFLDGTTVYAYIGGYVGYGNSVYNCVNNTAITYTSIGPYIGGIAGALTGNIENCTNNAKITADKAEYVGGIVGYSSIGSGANFTSLKNTAEIKGKNYVGGIFGRTNFSVDNSNNFTVNMTKLSNTGAVSGVDYVGGIVGYAYYNNSRSDRNITVTKSEFVNKANISGVNYVGGLIGYMHSDGSSKLSGSSSAGTISATGAYVGGLAGNTNSLIDDCDNEGTIINASGYLLDGTTVYAYIGGYVGYGNSISNCINNTVINYTNIGSYVGGIAGVLTGNAENCTNNASVTAASSEYVGGIAGGMIISGTRTFKTLTNNGAVSGKNQVAGIAGRFYAYVDSSYNYTITVASITNAADISGTDYVGAVMGYCDLNNIRSSRSFTLSMVGIKVSGNVAGTNYVGAIAGKLATDNSASVLMDYTLTGTVTGTENTDEIFGNYNNITIN